MNLFNYSKLLSGDNFLKTSALNFPGLFLSLWWETGQASREWLAPEFSLKRPY